MKSKPSLMPTVSVIIVGGGLVGLLFSALLADAGISTAIIEGKIPRLDWDENSPDARVSAINVKSKHLLQACDVWSSIDNRAYSPLVQLIAWDAIGGSEVIFNSAEIGEPDLGGIIENRAVIRALWKKCAAHPRVTLYCPQKPIALTQTPDAVHITLDNDLTLQAQCVVGADGGQSWVRQQMNSALLEKAYQQSALITVVETEKNHQRTGWQAFLSDGILALLPLANKNQCAIVWSTSTAHANTLAAVSEKEFNQSLNHHFGSRLGALTILKPPHVLPLWLRHAQQYVTTRLALIGDAAHTIHPLAGQGVNLGFMDAACLARGMIAAHTQHRPLAHYRVLRQYERTRKGENSQMSCATLGLKELFASSAPPIIRARNLGLRAIDHLPSIKNYLMRIATGEYS